MASWLDIWTYCLISTNLILAGITLNWTICYCLLREYSCLRERQPLMSVLIGTFNSIPSTSLILAHANLDAFISLDGIRIYCALCSQLFILSLFLLAFRGWLTFFRIKVRKAREDKVWRQYINPAENDWFIRHDQTLNQPQMLCPFLIPWASSATLYLFEVISQRAFSTFSRVVLTSQALLAMACLVYVWSRMPHFDDIWRLKHELIITIRVLLFGVAVFVSMALVLDISIDDGASWKYTVLIELLTLVQLGQSYGVVCYPLKRFGLPKVICVAALVRHSTAHRDIEIIRYKKKQSLDPDRDVNPAMAHQSTQFLKLKAILLHKDGFRLFAAHLMREFCIENLIFFVETSQWLDFVMERCAADGTRLTVDEKGAGIDIKFHHNVPKSRIVHWSEADVPPMPFGGDKADSSPDPDSGSVATNTGSAVHSRQSQISQSKTATATSKSVSVHAAQLTVDLNLDEFELDAKLDDPWMMCVKLFQKYIVNGSYFCINISGEDRIRLYELFGYDTSKQKHDDELVEELRAKCGNNVDTLFHLFDTARYAVFRLMIYSVSRFEASEAYLQHFIPDDDDADE